MRLGSVRAGDIVQADDGLPYYALVVGRDSARGALRVLALTGPRGQIRSVRAREVAAHWRRAGSGRDERG